MLLDKLLSHNTQLQTVPGLDKLPASELTDFLHRYLICCRVENKSRKTLIAYGQFVGYFIRFLASIRQIPGIAELHQDHIRLFLLSLQERKLAPESVSAYYRSLHTFFNWLKSEEYLERNPFDKLRAPRMPKKHVKGLPADVIDRVLRLCLAEKSFTGLRNCAIVLMFLDTGIRRAELQGIKLAEVYFDQGLIRVMGKGAKERIVRMGEITQKALLHYLLKRKDDRDDLWVTEEGKPLSEQGITTAMVRLAQRAGIPKTLKRGTHAYRHTAATSYLRNHGNLKCLQEMMGHENIKTTMRYADALGPEAMIADHRLASPVDNFLGNKARKKQVKNR